MLEPNPHLLALMITNGVRPAYAEDGQDVWSMSPIDLSNMPTMLLSIRMLTSAAEPHDTAVKTEIERYKSICHHGITIYDVSHDLILYEVDVSIKGSSSFVTRREFRVKSITDQVWLKISLGWTLLDWYLDALQSFEDGTLEVTFPNWRQGKT